MSGAHPEIPFRPGFKTPARLRQLVPPSGAPSGRRSAGRRGRSASSNIELVIVPEEPRFSESKERPHFS